MTAILGSSSFDVAVDIAFSSSYQTHPRFHGGTSVNIYQFGGSAMDELDNHIHRAIIFC